MGGRGLPDPSPALQFNVKGAAVTNARTLAMATVLVAKAGWAQPRWPAGEVHSMRLQLGESPLRRVPWEVAPRYVEELLPRLAPGRRALRHRLLPLQQRRHLASISLGSAEPSVVSTLCPWVHICRFHQPWIEVIGKTIGPVLNT